MTPPADDEATPDQVEATAEAADAEGHAEQTAAGTADVEVPATAEPEPETDPTTPDSSDALRLELLQAFKDELGDAVVGAHIRDGDDLWVLVTPEAWRDAAQVAKGRLGCSAFCFLSAIDWMPSPWGRSEDSPFDQPANPAGVVAAAPALETGYAGGETRFQVFLRVTNPVKGYGVTIKADVADPEIGVATLIPVYPGANWHEREAWEMYGIGFIGHPHLVHLYLPGAFEGHPLRKDFPLLARQVKPWPGIVDVEPMPDEGDDESADGEGAADAPTEEANA